MKSICEIKGIITRTSTQKYSRFKMNECGNNRCKVKVDGYKVVKYDEPCHGNKTDLLF